MEDYGALLQGINPGDLDYVPSEHPERPLSPLASQLQAASQAEVHSPFQSQWPFNTHRTESSSGKTSKPPSGIVQGQCCVVLSGSVADDPLAGGSLQEQREMSDDEMEGNEEQQSVCYLGTQAEEDEIDRKGQEAQHEERKRNGFSFEEYSQQMVEELALEMMAPSDPTEQLMLEEVSRDALFVAN
jgi:hypothetical protein